MNRTGRTAQVATAAVGIAIVIGALTACSSTSAPVATSSPVVSVTTPAAVTVETTPAVVAPVALAVGATVTAEQAAVLPAGQHGYKMADGSLVLVDKAAPLPEEVKADITAPVTAVLAARGANSASDSTPMTTAANSGVAQAIGQTGRNAVVIYKMFGADGRWAWQASGAAMLKPIAHSNAAILAHVQEYIAAQKDPSSWEIIDASNF